MLSELNRVFVTGRADFADACFSEVFFPLGFPVRVSTNRREVIDEARTNWSCCWPKSELEPLLINLEFFSNLSRGVVTAVETHVDGKFLTVDFDEQGIVIADLQEGVARGVLSEKVLTSKLHLGYYVLEAAALSMISTLRAVALHAACISWRGVGILLCGESGAGKTTLAYACARSGWTYVSDDASYLSLRSQTRRVVGNHHKIRFRDAATNLFDELCGKTVTSRATGKPSIELLTAELEDVRTAAHADVKFILFLSRNDAFQPTLQPLEPEIARNYFKRFFLLQPDSESPTGEAIDDLLSVPIFEFRYARLEPAVSFLTKIAESGNSWPADETND